MSDYQRAVGRILREKRITADITQTQLARAVGVNVATYGCWERGERHMRVESLAALARVYGVLTEELLPGEGEVR